MPVVILKATDFGLQGNETPDVLEANAKLTQLVEKIRLQAGELMGLGDVTNLTVPKMSLVSPGCSGGVINTRTFIPHRVHEAIGVLGAVSVASACVIEGSVAQQVCNHSFSAGEQQLEVEHPSGFFTVEIAFDGDGKNINIYRSALLRTARKLMEGYAFIPELVEAS